MFFFFLVLTAACGGLCVALALTVVARKARRDRREARRRSRCGTAEQAVLDGDETALRDLFRSACRDAEAQLVLAATLETVAAQCGRARINALNRHARASGLRDALAAQTRSRRAVRRGRAALLIGLLHLTDTCPLLGPLLADEDPDVQLAAARALSRRRDRQAAALLIGAIETGALPPERIVERVSERWAVPALLESLRRARARPAGDAGAAVVPLGASLAQALGLAGATEAESDLIGLLRGGGFEERISAARALAAVGGQRSLAGLIDALENDEWQVRGQAASALGAQPGPDAVRALTGAMSDRSWWVRANAGRALRALAEPGVAALRETASSSKDAFARDRAREELAVAELEGLAA